MVKISSSCKMQLLAVLSLVILSSGCGSSSSDSASPDTIAPEAPTFVTAVAASSTIVSVRWAASTDNVGVTGYKIYRGSSQIGTAPDVFYSDTTCVAATMYAYTVAAYDAAGNTSAVSSSVSTTTLTVGTDLNDPPSTPADLTATALNSSKISLSWSPSIDTIGVSGYYIYSAATATAPPTKVSTSTTTSYTHTGLTAATKYYYVVTAIDGYPNESLRSNQAFATTLQAP